MKNEELYRRLAADGNKDAQVILDTEAACKAAMPDAKEGEGAAPSEEASETESEELETGDDEEEETEEGGE